MKRDKRFGSQQRHDLILYGFLYPYVEKLTSNNSKNGFYLVAPEVKVYHNGDIKFNPDLFVQNGVRDLAFEVKSSREVGSWKKAVVQAKKCENYYRRIKKGFSFYVVRPAKIATDIGSLSDIEIELLLASGPMLDLEKHLHSL